MARKTKEESEKTREILLDAAEDIFLKKGVAAATLEDIATHAGLTRGAVYWHFENKQALFDAMHARVKLPLEDLLEKALGKSDPLNALREHCIEVLRDMARNARMQRVFTILLLRCEDVDTGAACSASRAYEKRSETIKKFELVFKKAQKDGNVNAELDPATIANGLMFYMCGIFTNYLREPDEFDITADAPQLIDIYFRGLR